MRSNRLVVMSLLVILGIGFIGGGVEAKSKKQPNIIFIYADDHAQAAISSYGSKMNLTPHIDQLAKEGMRFSQSFVANSICGPARATLLTGAHSHINGKITNGGGFKDNLPTFAKSLKKAGYRTAMVGKWHIKPDPNGFDYWSRIGGGYYNPTMRTSEGVKKFEGYTTEVITEDALKWIGEQDKTKPFMVWISHTATHRTWMPGQQYLKRYDDRDIPEPVSLFDDYKGRSKAMADTQMRISRDLFPAYDLKLPITGKGFLDKYAQGRLSRLTPEERKKWDEAYGPKNEAFAKANLTGKALVKWKYQRYIKDYLRCVDALDDSVGRVMGYLKEKKMDENTIVIYSSDQGFFLGEHGWYDKRWMYEPAFRTPLIVKWPGVTKAGTVSDQLVQNIDMAATFCEMGGAEVPSAYQGLSLVPLLQGKKPSWRKGVYYHYHQIDRGKAAHTVARHYGIRTARYKLLHVYDYGDWELYDLKNDPHELSNLAGKPELADLQARLKGQLMELKKAYRDEAGIPDPKGVKK